MNKSAHDYGRLPKETLAYICQKVYRTASTMNLQSHDAEDLKQELLMVAYASMSSFNAAFEAGLATFLHKCIDDAVIDRVRKMRRMKNTKLLFVLDAPIDSSDGEDEPEAESSRIDHVEDEASLKAFRDSDLKQDVAAILKTLDKKMIRVCRIIMEGGTDQDVANFLKIDRALVYRTIYPRLRKVFAELH